MKEYSNSIPESLLVKLFDQTGNLNAGNKGYLLFSINADGEPGCIAKFADTTTEVAIVTSAKSFLDSAVSTQINQLDEE